MAEVLTGQEIVSDISTRLRNRFTTTQFKEIYKDTPVQGASPPYIFIHSVDTEHIHQLRGYGWRNYIVDIRCHPAKMQTNVQTWGRGVAEMVMDCLDTLTVDGQQVRAGDIEWKVEENVLHVIFKYGFRVRKVPDVIPDMQTLTYGEHIKDKE